MPYLVMPIFRNSLLKILDPPLLTTSFLVLRDFCWSLFVNKKTSILIELQQSIAHTM